MQDAAIEAVLDRARAAHELEQAVRSRQRHGAARPRHRHRLQGLDLADHLDRDRQRRPPTAAVTLYCSTVDMGQGSDTANAQIVAEVLNIPAESRQGRASRHRRDALRHGDARLALDSSTWAMRCGSPPRTRATSSRRWRARSACRRAATSRSPSCSRRNTGCRPATSSAPAATSRATCRPMRDGLTPEATPFWMVGGAGAEVEVDTETGHVQRDASSSTSPTPGGRSIRRSSRRSCRAPPSCSSASPCRRRWSSTRGQVTNASLADYKIPSILDIPPMHRTRRSRPRRAPARSAPRAWARAAPSACRRRSPTRSRTRSACGSPRCR